MHSLILDGVKKDDAHPYKWGPTLLGEDKCGPGIGDCDDLSCCSYMGFCGKSAAHCLCETCFDFSGEWINLTLTV